MYEKADDRVSYGIFIHFIPDIYIAPLQVGLLRSAQNIWRRW